MKITYQIARDECLVYVIQRGEVLYPDWEHALLQVLGDPRFEKSFNFLSDRRLVTNIPTIEAARSTATFFKSHESQMGCCSWGSVMPDTASYGMGRMLSILTDGGCVNVEVFEDYEEARRWLLDHRNHKSA